VNKKKTSFLLEEKAVAYHFYGKKTGVSYGAACLGIRKRKKAATLTIKASRRKQISPLLNLPWEVRHSRKRTILTAL